MLELPMYWEHKIQNKKRLGKWGKTRISKGSMDLNDQFLVRKGVFFLIELYFIIKYALW